MKIDICTKAVLTSIAIALVGCAGGGGQYNQQFQSGSTNGSGGSTDAQFLACVEREKPVRRTAPCADTLFNQYAAEPSHSLKPAKLRFAAAFHKVLLSFDKGEAGPEEIKASINTITAQFLQDVQDASRSEQTQALVRQIEEQNRRQSYQEAARIIRESTTPIIVPQPRDNSMSCRSYRNGNEIVTNCR